MDKIIIRELLQSGDYETVNNYLISEISMEEYDEDIAIFDATVGLYYQNLTRVWNACANGLALNPFNYELYVILG